MGLDLDEIRELAEDFATELPRKNRSKQTIDGYLARIRYFADFLQQREPPTTAPDITRPHRRLHRGPAHATQPAHR
ncbi:hypothetical protein AB4305_18850 [Nocardia sp. 2YAB30]|uniref:hypothetical protein n=1 Tax=unclassified Nocardia TaxID=2637762 RepID=UPI003F9472B8